MAAPPQPSRRWRVIAGPNAGLTGPQVAARAGNVTIEVGSWPGKRITLRRIDLTPDWQVGDDVVVHGLAGKITAVGDEHAQVFHGAGGDRPSGVSIVALRYLQLPDEAPT